MKSFVALTMAAFLTGTALAQADPATKKNPAPKAQQKRDDSAKPELTKPPAQKFSIGMLDAGRIDPGYQGAPIVEVVNAIEKLSGAPKGEFESTADYNSRKEASRTAKFLGDFTLDDTFAFVLSVPKTSGLLDGVGYDFNPDTGEVRLFVLPRAPTMNGIGAPDYQTNKRETIGLDQFDFDFRVNEKSTYEASNAYGAKVTVEKTRSARTGIAVNQIAFLNFKREIFYRNPIPAAKFNLENAVAARELPKLKAIFVVKLADPYVVYNYRYSEPTRANPVEMSTSGKYLTGDLLGVVFYSGISGEIFARIPESLGRTSTALASP